MKYAVAYMNYFDNDLKLTVIEAHNPITAMIEGARKLMGNPASDKWLDAMLQDTPAPDGHAAQIEEIQEEFFNTDQLIARIEEIREEFFNTDQLIGVMSIE